MPAHAAAVLRVVTRHAWQVTYCYNVGLKGDPELEGRLTVGFTVGRWRARDVHIVEDTLGDPGVAACVIERVEAWYFPPFVKGDVIFPFVLATPP